MVTVRNLVTKKATSDWEKVKRLGENSLVIGSEDMAVDGNTPVVFIVWRFFFCLIFLPYLVSMVRACSLVVLQNS